MAFVGEIDVLLLRDYPHAFRLRLFPVDDHPPSFEADCGPTRRKGQS
jgi:hypothetical protein